MGSQFWPNTCYTLKSILYTLEECVFYCCWMDYYAYVISILAVLLCKSSVSFLIFCFDDKSILGKGILKSPTVTVLLSACPFSSVNIWFIYYCCCSVIMSCPNHWDPHRLQHARLHCPSPSPGVCSNSCPLRWCHPTISYEQEGASHTRKKCGKLAYIKRNRTGRLGSVISESPCPILHDIPDYYVDQLFQKMYTINLKYFSSLQHKWHL